MLRIANYKRPKSLQSKLLKNLKCWRKLKKTASHDQRQVGKSEEHRWRGSQSKLFATKNFKWKTKFRQISSSAKIFVQNVLWPNQLARIQLSFSRWISSVSYSSSNYLDHRDHRESALSSFKSAILQCYLCKNRYIALSPFNVFKILLWCRKLYLRLPQTIFQTDN